MPLKPKPIETIEVKTPTEDMMGIRLTAHRKQEDFGYYHDFIVLTSIDERKARHAEIEIPAETITSLISILQYLQDEYYSEQAIVSNPDNCDVCGEPMSAKGYCYKCGTSGHPTFYSREIPSSPTNFPRKPLISVVIKPRIVLSKYPILENELNMLDEYIRIMTTNLLDEDAEKIKDSWKKIMNRKGTKVEIEIVQKYLNDVLGEDNYSNEIREAWRRILNARRLLRKY